MKLNIEKFIFSKVSNSNPATLLRKESLVSNFKDKF